MIDPLIFAAYLIVAGVGSVFAVSQLIRIARKGGPHGTRSRAAAERLDLFPPDVELGAVQRTDADAVTVSDPDCAPDADRIVDTEPHAFAELRAVVSAYPHADRRAVIDAYHRGFCSGLTAAEAELERVIVSSGERRSAVLRNGVDDV